MKKMALGILALAVVAGGLVAPASAQPQSPWGWMYLSLSPTEYVCAGSWVDTEQNMYFVIEAPGWVGGDNYNGFEYGIDYPVEIFNTGATMNSPFGGLVIGGCTTPGRCSFRAGSGGPIPDNPWTAMDLTFLGFGLGPNQVFRLTPSTPSSIPGSPVWLYYDAVNPVKIVPQHGDEGLNKPDWQRAYVVYDYARVEGDPFLDTDPCLRSVPTENRSWGAMKAGYDQ